MFPGASKPPYMLKEGANPTCHLAVPRVLRCVGTVPLEEKPKPKKLCYGRRNLRAPLDLGKTLQSNQVVIFLFGRKLTLGLTVNRRICLGHFSAHRIYFARYDKATRLRKGNGIPPSLSSAETPRHLRQQLVLTADPGDLPLL